MPSFPSGIPARRLRPVQSGRYQTFDGVIDSVPLREPPSSWSPQTSGMTRGSMVQPSIHSSRRASNPPAGASAATNAYLDTSRRASDPHAGANAARKGDQRSLRRASDAHAGASAATNAYQHTSRRAIDPHAISGAARNDYHQSSRRAHTDAVGNARQHQMESCSSPSYHSPNLRSFTSSFHSTMPQEFQDGELQLNMENTYFDFLSCLKKAGSDAVEHSRSPLPSLSSTQVPNRRQSSHNMNKPKSSSRYRSQDSVDEAQSGRPSKNSSHTANQNRRHICTTTFQSDSLARTSLGNTAEAQGRATFQSDSLARSSLVNTAEAQGSDTVKQAESNHSDLPSGHLLTFTPATSARRSANDSNKTTSSNRYWSTGAVEEASSSRPCKDASSSRPCKDSADIPNISLSSIMRSFRTPPQLQNPDPQCQTAFDLLKVDDKLHIGLLSQAVLLVCHHMASPHWVSQALQATTEAARHSSLNFSQFCSFIHHYQAIEWKAAEKEFSKYDHHQSGKIDRKSLASLLTSMGSTQLAGALDDVVDEVLAAVGLGSSVDVSLDEFVRVQRLLKNRGCFSESEDQALRKAFTKFDKDRSGEIEIHELGPMLKWLGYPVNQATAEALLHEADTDGSGGLCMLELMLVMRKFRDLEIGVFKEAFAIRSKDGCIDREALPGIFSEIGYPHLVPGILEELYRDVNLAKGDPINFDTCWRMVLIFRARCGHVRRELEELQRVFTHFAISEAGSPEEVSLGEVELGFALRWLGFSPCPEWLQDLFTENDSDGSGRIEFSEFLKLMRRLREVELKIVQETFVKEANADGLLPVKTLRDILTTLKYMPNLALLQRILQKYGAPHADFCVYLSLLDQFRQSARQDLRDHMGFNAHEVWEHESQFQVYDQTGSGTVHRRDLGRLLQSIESLEVENRSALSATTRRQLAQLVSEVNADGRASIDFPTYLQLMQMHTQLAEIEKSKTHFSQVKSRNLREIFDVHADCHGQLSLVDFQSLTSQVLNPDCFSPLLPNLEDFADKVLEGRMGTLDFSEFLLVLRLLSEEHFGDVNHIAALLEAVVHLDKDTQAEIETY